MQTDRFHIKTSVLFLSKWTWDDTQIQPSLQILLIFAHFNHQNIFYDGFFLYNNYVYQGKKQIYFCLVKLWKLFFSTPNSSLRVYCNIGWRITVMYHLMWGTKRHIYRYQCHRHQTWHSTTVSICQQTLGLDSLWQVSSNWMKPNVWGLMWLLTIFQPDDKEGNIGEHVPPYCRMDYHPSLV